MNIELLKKELLNLNDKQLDEIIHFVEDHKLLNGYDDIFSDALESKYNHAFKCPHCGSESIKKNGHFSNGSQKYFCKHCKKNFSSKKGSILENTKLQSVTWLKFIIAMSEDKSLRECATYAGVSLKTSFFMRHKIANALSHEMNKVQLEGIVELDETSVNISYSGHHKNNVLPRKAYKRGRKSLRYKHKSDTTDSIQIACATDRCGHIYLKVAKVGSTTIDIETVKKAYGHILENIKTLCTDGLFAYKALVENNKIEHIVLKNNDKVKRGLYHINHINYIHSKIKEYMKRHKGISCKYLDEYLSIIAYNIRHKNNDLHNHFVNFFKYECDFRRVNYIGTPFLTKN